MSLLNIPNSQQRLKQTLLSTHFQRSLPLFTTQAGPTTNTTPLLLFIPLLPSSYIHSCLLPHHTSFRRDGLYYAHHFYAVSLSPCLVLEHAKD